MSAYKTLDECADELERHNLKMEIDNMRIDLQQKEAAAADAKDKARREEIKFSELKIAVAELNDGGLEAVPASATREDTVAVRCAHGPPDKVIRGKGPLLAIHCIVFIRDVKSVILR